MKNRVIVVILTLLSVGKLSGQVIFNSPKSINQALRILDRKLSKETKDKIIKTNPDSLLFLERNSRNEFDVMDKWFWKYTRKSTTKSTRFGRYYKRKGLKIPKDMIDVVLRCFQLELKKLPIKHEKVLEPFVLRQRKHSEEDKIRFTTDSLRGVYIPENIEDCFRVLDKLYPDSTKSEIANLTERKYSTKNHLFGAGIWMRNNWQLWGGSRLSKHFNQLGIYHPDDMSGIIMDSYHRYLRNKDIRLDEQIKEYQDYWEETKNKNGG